MNKTVVEVVTFKLNAGFSDADYVAASQKTEDFIGGMRGFIDRRLSKGEDGTWMDYVVWADITAAQEASAQFEQADCTADIMRMIDPKSLVMRHESQMWTMSSAPAMG